MFVAENVCVELADRVTVADGDDVVDDVAVMDTVAVALYVLVTLNVLVNDEVTDGVGVALGLDRLYTIPELLPTITLCSVFTAADDTTDDPTE